MVGSLIELPGRMTKGGGRKTIWPSYQLKVENTNTIEKVKKHLPAFFNSTSKRGSLWKRKTENGLLVNGGKKRPKSQRNPGKPFFKDRRPQQGGTGQQGDNLPNAAISTATRFRYTVGAQNWGRENLQAEGKLETAGWNGGRR